ncbi:hypothetical protein B0T13DRAFT_480069 [Neurospora crassa]|nr:hypothetical protein B0T13DRAFT_480069 [Neurospora crassa]
MPSTYLLIVLTQPHPTLIMCTWITFLSTPMSQPGITTLIRNSWVRGYSDMVSRSPSLTLVNKAMSCLWSRRHVDVDSRTHKWTAADQAMTTTQRHNYPIAMQILQLRAGLVSLDVYHRQHLQVG